MLLRTTFDGDDNLGLHGFATDKYCLLGTPRHAAKIKDTLKVKAFDFQILNMDLVKIFVTGNSTGIVTAKLVEDFEDLDKLKEHFEVLVLNTLYSSMGNLILLNDKGVILSPLLRKYRKNVEKFFGLPCETTTIAGLNLVGSLGFATNKGCLCHPKLKEKEKKIIEKVLGVDADITTVNFGSPYPGAGLIANSSGLIMAKSCSGPEMGRITDVLGFIE